MVTTMTKITWHVDPDADNATISLGGMQGELSIELRVTVTDRKWEVDGATATQFTGDCVDLIEGVCTSRHDGRRAALAAIEQTLQTALLQVQGWRLSAQARLPTLAPLIDTDAGYAYTVLSDRPVTTSISPQPGDTYRIVVPGYGRDDEKP